jgi:excinuclease ABC subunit C
MMKEVLRRRFARLVKEEDEGDSTPAPTWCWSTAARASWTRRWRSWPTWASTTSPSSAWPRDPDRDAGLERFFMPGKTPFMLEPKSPVLYYLQRLRDEAHRFAIGAHRTRRRWT